jgi:hypothetical protein
MDAGIRIQFSGLLYGRILRCLDGEGLFDAAAEDGVTVRMFFDKKAFVLVAHNRFRVVFISLSDPLAATLIECSRNSAFMAFVRLLRPKAPAERPGRLELVFQCDNLGSDVGGRWAVAFSKMSLPAKADIMSGWVLHCR